MNNELRRSRLPVLGSLRARRVLALLVTLLLFATGCGGSASVPTDETSSGGAIDAEAQPDDIAGDDAAGTDDTEADDTADGAAVESGEEPIEEPTVAPTSPPAPTPTATPTPPAGWADELEVGDCFDNVADAGDGTEPVAGPALDCNGDHEYELFFLAQVDEPADAPYPADQAFTDRLFDEFCDAATAEFGGAAPERLPFPVGAWTPTEQEWAAGDRTVGCVAQAALRDDNPYKIGSAAGAGLTTDDGVVARSTVNGQVDFFFSFQASTLYPLTNGEFDLPPVSPAPGLSGFLFASAPVDGETSGGAYNYDYATGDTIQLETGLDGYEFASPLFVLDIPAFVYAARENAEDDWDIHLARAADDVVALTDSDADDRWPTLTPDGRQIVYHSDGDIWIMNVDGSDKQQLTTDPAGDYESSVSPDGTRILFTSNRSGDDDVWIMNIDGSDQRNLTNHPAADAWPFFSADGEYVYFQTDRLGVNSNLMVMRADGGDQSWFSFEFMTNAALLPAPITERFVAELPTLAETLEAGDGGESEVISGVVPGTAGERSEVVHTSRRLAAALPAGWEYEEISYGDDSDLVASLLAAPSLADYRQTWAADGVQMTLVEADREVFDEVQDGAAAANDAACTRTGDSVNVNGSRTTTRWDFECGSATTAIVVGVYESEAGVGLLFEGQWDGVPDAQADEDLITAIGQAARWR